MCNFSRSTRLLRSYCFSRTYISYMIACASQLFLCKASSPQAYESLRYGQNSILNSYLPSEGVAIRCLKLTRMFPCTGSIEPLCYMFKSLALEFDQNKDLGGFFNKVRRMWLHLVLLVQPMCQVLWVLLKYHPYMAELTSGRENDGRMHKQFHRSMYILHM